MGSLLEILDSMRRQWAIKRVVLSAMSVLVQEPRTDALQTNGWLFPVSLRCAGILPIPELSSCAAIDRERKRLFHLNLDGGPWSTTGRAFRTLGPSWPATCCVDKPSTRYHTWLEAMRLGEGMTAVIKSAASLEDTTTCLVGTWVGPKRIIANRRLHI